MSWRRIITAAVGFGVLACSALVAQAAPVTVTASDVRAGYGSVTVATTAPADGSLDYSVAWSGTIAGHGWTYQGEVTGDGHLDGWQNDVWTQDHPSGWYLPEFPVASSNGRISGSCAGSPGPVSGETFDCVLARDGGTPWQILIDTTLDGSGTGGVTTASGTYRETEAEVSAVGADAGISYGDVQLMTRWVECGGSTCGGTFGPLRLTGQVAIGSSLFRGDLVTTETSTNPSTCCWEMPPLAITGKGEGGHVTGSCSGAYDFTKNDVAGLASVMAIDLTCDLSLNGRPAVAVPLQAALSIDKFRCGWATDGTAECWEDQAGWFTTR